MRFRNKQTGCVIEAVLWDGTERTFKIIHDTWNAERGSWCAVEHPLSLNSLGGRPAFREGDRLVIRGVDIPIGSWVSDRGTGVIGWERFIEGYEPCVELAEPKPLYSDDELDRMIDAMIEKMKEKEPGEFRVWLGKVMTQLREGVK